MRIKICALAMVCALFASAQEVRVVSQQQLLKDTESNCHNPVLSPDGTKLLFSSSSYAGLRMYDFEDDVVTKIADDQMAGFDPIFSNDGNTVYFLSQTREDMRVYRAMKSFDLRSSSVAAVTEKSRGMQNPVSVDGGVAVVSDNGLVLKTKRQGALKPYAYSDGKNIVVVKNGVEKRIQPVETKYTYLWVSMSPDGDKILFYAGAKGAYVCDLEGNVISSLGKYISPVWYGNDYVVAQHSTSDGHQYESSQIVLVKADGSFKKELTTPVSMTMNPTASAVANRIAYNTIDGRLFVMELEIK